MTNVIPFQRKNPMPVAAEIESYETEIRPKFSFDMTQPDPRGFVLIDACVPMSFAVEFMNLLTAYDIAEDAEPSTPAISNKRRTRKKATA
jgi:hypothetical protein